MVRSLSADRVIDYTKEDFTKDVRTYDLIFDIVGASSFSRCQQSLKPHAVILQNIMGLTTLLRILWTPLRRQELKGGVAMEHPQRMNFIAELVAAGKLKAAIDSSYPRSGLPRPSSMLSKGTRREMS
jgi:NADPH:quinone reductase-like Zn-dependent oxidoreductase